MERKRIAYYLSLHHKCITGMGVLYNIVTTYY